MLLSICLYYNLQICPFQYAYICTLKIHHLYVYGWVSLYESLALPILWLKDTYLQMHVNGSQQRSSVYASNRVSKVAPLYMPT
jgi:hypothetical protein